MNGQSQIIDQQTLRQQRRPRFYISRTGSVVNDEPVVQVSPITSVSWEAYVVDTETNQAIEAYSRLSGVDTIRVDQAHSNHQIQQLYLEKAAKQPNIDIDLLNNNLDSGLWCISTHVLSTKPLD